MDTQNQEEPLPANLLLEKPNREAFQQGRGQRERSDLGEGGKPRRQQPRGESLTHLLCLRI